MDKEYDSLDWFKVVLWIWAFPIMFGIWIYNRLREDKS